jgi:uncharacterized small protein (DUF1192 family)
MVMAGILTGSGQRSTIYTMFDEPDLPRRKADVLAELGREDLDKLSIAELDARIAALEAEIARSKAKREGATRFRAAADSLFKR